MIKPNHKQVIRAFIMMILMAIAVFCIGSLLKYWGIM